MYNAEGQLNKEQLVQHHAPLVKRIAYHLMSRLPSSVQVDDLIQNGMLGLLDALEKFGPGQDAQFETYAAQRIRGAMLDGLRENDWLPRSLRREMRRMEAMVHQLEQKAGRPPTEKELADALGMPLAEYQKMLHDAKGHQLVYLEDMAGEGEEDFLERHVSSEETDPAFLLEDADMRQHLVKAIEALPEREKLMMGLYYEQELNLKEIGEVMGVTESRVCQIHSQAVSRLRAELLHGEKAPVKKRGRPRRG